MAMTLGGCASQYSMDPDAKSATDSLQLVESDESFMLAGTVAFRPTNQQTRVIIGPGRYIKYMTSTRGDFYAGPPRNIALWSDTGLPERISGGVYVPRENGRLCLVFWMKPRSPELLPDSTSGRASRIRFADTHGITFYTWIKRSITAIPLCNN